MNARDIQIKAIDKLREDVDCVLEESAQLVAVGKFIDAWQCLTLCRLLITNNTVAIRARLGHMALIHADDKDDMKEGENGENGREG